MKHDFGQTLKEYIGTKPKHTKTIIKEKIKEIYSQYSKDKLITDFKINKISTLWQSMSFKLKVKWLWYNFFNKKLGNSIRAKIDQQNDLLIEDFYKEYPEDDFCDSGISLIPYPDYVNRSPKSIIVTAISFTPIQPLEFITYEVDLKTKRTKHE